MQRFGGSHFPSLPLTPPMHQMREVRELYRKRFYNRL